MRCSVIVSQQDLVGRCVAQSVYPIREFLTALLLYWRLRSVLCCAVLGTDEEGSTDEEEALGGAYCVAFFSACSDYVTSIPPFVWWGVSRG